MFINFILFLILLLLISILSQKISNLIYNVVYLLTNSKNFSLGVLIVILLPGTIIHEFSHLLVALLLRVPTGHLSILPTIDKTGQVQAGKLTIAKPDPFRHTLIGIAPLLIGLTLIFIIGRLFFSQSYSLTTHNLQPTTILGIYLYFVISATMFASRHDLESFVIVAPLIIIIIMTIYLIGVKIVFDQNLVSLVSSFLTQLNSYLAYVILINILIFLIFTGLISLLQKILGRKIVPQNHHS